MAFHTLVLVYIVGQYITVASAKTLTAALNHSTWRNDTFAFPVSQFESANVDTPLTATLSKNYVTRTFRSKDSLRSKTVGDHDTTPLAKPLTTSATSIKPLETSALPALPHATWAMEKDDAASYMGEIVAAFEGIISAPKSKLDPHNRTDSNCSVTSPALHSNASCNYTVASTPISMAAIDLFRGSVVFLNTTSPNYVLIDYVNASVMIWTAPTTTSTTPKSGLRKVVDNINSWLPYVEALGILTLLWKIGEFIYGRIKRRRGRRVQSEN